MSASLHILTKLGLSVILSKSSLQPTQVLQFIGTQLHTIHQWAYLPIDMAITLQKTSQDSMPRLVQV